LGDSLSDIVPVYPEWWTPTARAKAIVRAVLSLGLLHGHLTVNNVIFNEDGVIQIKNVCLNRFMKPEGGGDGMVDVEAFLKKV
jgi:tRNA A-37 threonylcarbamoyl transferase component Bud32